MTVDEITKIVQETLAKDPALLMREFLNQQIHHHKSEIQWHQEKIAKLKEELRDL